MESEHNRKSLRWDREGSELGGRREPRFRWDRERSQKAQRTSLPQDGGRRHSLSHPTGRPGVGPRPFSGHVTAQARSGEAGLPKDAPAETAASRDTIGHKRTLH